MSLTPLGSDPFGLPRPLWAPQGFEVSEDALQRVARLERSDTGAVEGDHLTAIEGAVVEQVEGGGEVATEAVAGDVEAGSAGDGAVALEFGIPVFHVRDLSEGPAGVMHFQRVGGHAVADGVVDEFGGAEGEDEFVGFGVLEQRAAESGRRIDALIDDGPAVVLDKLPGLCVGEEGGVFVSVLQRL